MTLIVLYVVIHYLFVSQTSQVLALFGVFLDVGTRGGVPLPLMSFGLLFASSYFSVITPQGGSQNIIFAASGYLTQRELYKLGSHHHSRIPGDVPADRVAVGVFRHALTTAATPQQALDKRQDAFTSFI